MSVRLSLLFVYSVNFESLQVRGSIVVLDHHRPDNRRFNGGLRGCHDAVQYRQTPTSLPLSPISYFGLFLDVNAGLLSIGIDNQVSV